MAHTSDAWTTDPIAALVRVHFPELNERTPEGEAFLVQPENVKQTKREQADAFRQHLAALPADQLNIAIAEGKKLADERYQQWRSSELAKPFYARVTAEMDVDHWSRTAYWTVEEAAALSLGKDPREVTRLKVEAIRPPNRFASEYLARLDILERAQTMHQLYHSTNLTRFLAWIEHTRFPMPEALVDAAKAIHRLEVDWKGEYQKLKEKFEKYAQETSENFENFATLTSNLEGTVSTEFAKAKAGSLGARERESLLKLVIGMAIKGYGHDPHKSRTSTASEIASDLAALGIALSDDTVRAYLQEARDLLPPPESEQKR